MIVHVLMYDFLILGHIRATSTCNISRHEYLFDHVHRDLYVQLTMRM